jgi:hypothetical protein
MNMRRMIKKALVWLVFEYDKYKDWQALKLYFMEKNPSIEERLKLINELEERWGKR